MCLLGVLIYCACMKIVYKVLVLYVYIVEFNVFWSASAEKKKKIIKWWIIRVDSRRATSRAVWCSSISIRIISCQSTQAAVRICVMLIDMFDCYCYSGTPSSTYSGNWWKCELWLFRRRRTAEKNENEHHRMLKKGVYVYIYVLYVISIF